MQGSWNVVRRWKKGVKKKKKNSHDSQDAASSVCYAILSKKERKFKEDALNWSDDVIKTEMCNNKKVNYKDINKKFK